MPTPEEVQRAMQLVKHGIGAERGGALPKLYDACKVLAARVKELESLCESRLHQRWDDNDEYRSAITELREQLASAESVIEALNDGKINHACNLADMHREKYPKQDNAEGDGGGDA